MQRAHRMAFRSQSCQEAHGIRSGGPPHGLLGRVAYDLRAVGTHDIQSVLELVAAFVDEEGMLDAVSDEHVAVREQRRPRTVTPHERVTVTRPRCDRS